MSERALCTRCRRRSATYLRRQSGERLCTTCLYRDLVKEVRRAFSFTSKRGVGLKVGVLVSSCWLVEGFVLSKVLNDVEREFQGVTVGLIVEDRLLECANDLRRYVDEVVFLHWGQAGIKEYLDSGSAPNISGIRLDIVAVPLTLNDILSDFLRNLIYRGTMLRRWISVRGDGFDVLAPMYRILRTDVYSYALTSGMLRRLELCHQIEGKAETVDKLVALLSMEHPELLYRFLHSYLAPPQRKTLIESDPAM